ncbi:hypothetical protein DPMN_032639 [Dreissena polymorpha]|uniref:Uncharacterized protein n=1 Tax=Dreissena polymorpha TaxID=45954 RepID=A0A9D4M452_DREPO|nr:hypothetical protein DPMN_032639 [Dreissena polymorpha]
MHLISVIENIKKRETKAGASDIARIYSILATRLSVCRTIGVSLEETKTGYLGRRAGQTIASLTVQHNVRTTNSSPMHGHQPPPGPGLSFVSQGSTTPGHVSGIGEITAYLEVN